MRKHFLTAFLILCFAGIASAQNPWTGILDPSRAIDWRVSGLPGTLPDGETTPNPWTPPTRTTICKTESSGATVATINTDLGTCPAGQVLKLPCDKSITNAANATVHLGSQNNVTLRGCGADQTTIYMPNGAGVTWQNPGLGEPSCTWSAGYAIGTTVLTASCAPTIGTVIKLSASGVTIDPGSVPFFCSDQGICTEEGGTNGITQTVIVTATSGTGPFSVTVSPALYLNFASPQSSPTFQQQTNEAVGDGLEDLTVDCTNNTTNACLYLAFSHYNWMKGVRVINGKVAGEQLALNVSFRNLVANSYFYAQVITNAAEQNILVNDSSADLFINNIGQMGFGIYTGSPTSGEVFAYNLLRDGAGSAYAGCCYANSTITEHYIAAFNLLEGNELAQYEPDLIHGTHGLGTMFRNLAFGSEPPFKTTANTTAVSLDGYTRFYNIVGNVLGTSGINNKYVSTPVSNGSAPVITLGVKAGYSGYQFPTDPVAQPTTMLWGNYDVITNAVRWCGVGAAGFSSPPCSSVSEVPSALTQAVGYQQSLSGSGSGPYTATLSNPPCIYGDEIVSATGASVVGIDVGINGTITGPGIASGTVVCGTPSTVSITFSSTPTTPVINYLNQTATASAFQNPVPASTTLPPSFVLPTTAHPSGGTGLSWWKVSTNYPTNSTFQTPPFPPIGPDVMGGPETNGSYDIPAFIAWKFLPVDATYQSAYSITGSSWSGGTETLTVTVNSTYATQGEFQISSGACAGTFLATNSTATTLQYAVGSNPGSCTGANVLYPDIRAFNENVYQLDSNSTVSLAPGSNNFGSVNVGSSSSPVTFTLTNNSAMTATSVSPSTSGGNSGDFTITNSGAGSCSAAGGSIAATASCTFTVTFSPSGAGSRSTTLSVSYSGGDSASPQTSALSGTGVSVGVTIGVSVGGGISISGGAVIR